METLKNNSNFELLFFYNKKCFLSKKLIKKLNILENEFENIKFHYHDVYDLNNKKKLLNHNITEAPSILIISDNIEIKRIIGLVMIKPLRKILRELKKEI